MAAWHRREAHPMATYAYPVLALAPKSSAYPPPARRSNDPYKFRLIILQNKRIIVPTRRSILSIQILVVLLAYVLENSRNSHHAGDVPRCMGDEKGQR